MNQEDEEKNPKLKLPQKVVEWRQRHKEERSLDTAPPDSNTPNQESPATSDQPPADNHSNEGFAES